ncbi:hypothetical protein PV328_003033 [Microctonus aethiopoides]|uniref:Fucosyltransferase n=1 Tax=Microctonus aethiopoides TaxID=144406 RepID=A0AA39F7I5_9HYME|nr:hypothetical protein PV328_003033 [Microctonus aethiopoides]
MKTMCWIKLYTLFFYVIIFAICALMFQVYVELYNYDNTPIHHEDSPIVLWWTPFGSHDDYRKCGNVSCFFTQNRSYVNNRNLKVILYYGSNVEIADLPIPRLNNVKWGLLHEESPRNNLMFVHEDALKLFNYSATFSRYSDVPLTTVDLPGINELLGTMYFLPTEQKNQLMKEKKLAPVLYIQSNCDTMNDRDLYILELMKYIPVDSYGSCINNRQLPNNLKENYVDQLNRKEFMEFVAQYKFTLAFENAVCDDYITEKLWRPLIVGSVPVYYGSPSFKDWLPSNNSAIAVNDFKNPKELAEYLLACLKDDKKYEDHLRHKLLKNEINNKRLLDSLKIRPNDLFSIFGYYVREFECYVCEKSQLNELRTVTKKQYNCLKPMNIWQSKNDSGYKKNFWLDMWEQEACTAKILFHAISNSQSINMQKFDIEKMEMYESKKCF